MGKLRKRVIHVDPSKIRPTEEELKIAEKEWEMLCEGKSVCITDPSKSGTPDEALDALKNPNRTSCLCIDYEGDTPYSEFYKQSLNEES